MYINKRNTIESHFFLGATLRYFYVLFAERLEWIGVSTLAVRIPEETINEIRQKTNITDVVSQYVQLKKQGKNLFGFCPFHEERTPSFSVTEEKQIYHCFSCGRGGNVFSFLMEVDGLSFPEAVAKTAEMSSVPMNSEWLNQQNKPPTVADTKRELLIQLHEETMELYHHILLNTTAGEEALEYLLDRGLTREIIETFKIGFSPKERTVLLQYLRGKEYTDEQLKDSGLFITRENGDMMDRFSNRILFPVENEQGKVVAFSGRLLKASDNPHFNEPKYLNSPETELFNKRRVLFNYKRARSTIRKEQEAILFEGFMDVISAYQAGIKNAIATMGTSLTNEQIHMLDRITDKIVVAYDGDNAGIEATKRATDLLTEETHFDLEIVSFPEGLDPDDYIKQKGTEHFVEFIQHGRDTLFSFKMRYYRKSLNLNNESERLGYIETILAELLTVPSAIEREIYLKQLAEEFDITLETLQEQFQQTFYDYQREKAKEAKQQPQQPERRQPSSFLQIQTQRKEIGPVERAERLLLNRLFHFEAAWIQVKSIDTEFHFVHDEYQMLYVLYESFMDQTDNQGTVEAFMDFVKEPELRNLLAELELMAVNDEMSEREIRDCVDIITRKSSLHDQLKEKQLQIKEASRNGNQEQMRILMKEVVDLSRLLKS